MRLTNKIQCPSCGATGSFLEKEPGRYTCVYCNSIFEHTSILPEKTVLQIFFDQMKDLYDTHIVFLPDRAQYYARMFNVIMQMDAHLRPLKNSSFYLLAFNNLEELIQREFRLLKDQNIDIGIGKEAIYSDSETFVRLKYLVFYNTILAHHKALLAGSESELLEALTYAENAGIIQNKLNLGYDTDIARSKVGVLRRLHKKEEVFSYLAELTGFFKVNEEMDVSAKNEIEQAKVDFEPILLSEEYQNFIDTKRN